MNEIWKDIPGYEGKYQASTGGRIRSLSYEVYGRNPYTGELFKRAINGKPPEGTEILHKNGNPEDNRLENLRYGTRTENILDVYRQGGTWRKLSTDDVDAIRFGLFCGMRGVDLARTFGVSPNAISCIKSGRTFSWLK